MKRWIVFLFLFANFVYTQTNVSGNVSGTWTTANSPYIATNNLVLQPADTLIINPGVEVKFDGNYRFDIFGTLFAIGTDSNMITFTRNGSTNWMSMNFSDASNDTSTLQYCIIEYGSESGYDPYRGVINCNASSPTISNNIIQYNDDIGIYICGSSAQPLISGNTFQYNSSNCVHVENYAHPTISGNTITSTYSTGIYLNQYCSNTDITNNTIWTSYEKVESTLSNVC